MAGSTNWDRTHYLSLALWFFPAAVVTWGFHEFAHWVTGRLLGYEMWITFNQAGLAEGAYRSRVHEVLVGMAGPSATWIQGIIAWTLIRRQCHVRYYAFLFLAFWMRAVAMGISYTSQPNDEAASSVLLGFPMWLLPAISVSFLLVLTVSGSKTLHAGWKGNVLAYVMASLVISIVVVANALVF